LDEKEIITGLKSRNRDSFKELIKSFGDRVYNTSLGFVQNAEDITQEVFIEVFNSISKFKFESSLST
jgi:DNA-directed RNA polymerase specialized sigma24 family protein